MAEEEYLSYEQVLQELQVNRRQLNQLIRDGRLQEHVVEGETQFRASEVTDLKEVLQERPTVLEEEAAEPGTDVLGGAEGGEAETEVLEEEAQEEAGTDILEEEPEERDTEILEQELAEEIELEVEPEEEIEFEVGEEVAAGGPSESSLETELELEAAGEAEVEAEAEVEPEEDFFDFTSALESEDFELEAAGEEEEIEEAAGAAEEEELVSDLLAEEEEEVAAPEGEQVSEEELLSEIMEIEEAEEEEYAIGEEDETADITADITTMAEPTYEATELEEVIGGREEEEEFGEEFEVPYGAPVRAAEMGAMPAVLLCIALVVLMLAGLFLLENTVPSGFTTGLTSWNPFL